MGTGSGFDPKKGLRKANKQAVLQTIGLGVASGALTFLASPESMAAIGALLPAGPLTALGLPAIGWLITYGADWVKHRRPKRQGGVVIGDGDL